MLNRRDVLKALPFLEHRPLLARLQGKPAPAAAVGPGPLPAASIGKLKVTRLICGGNLFSGFAHAGDLVYATDLLKHYFTEDKILETLQLAEESGINTAILRTDDHIVRVLKRYRKERGGKMQWIAQTYPAVNDLRTNVQLAIDNGAVAAFPMGGVAERFLKAGGVELIAEVLAFMRSNGLAAGAGAHTLALAKAIDALKVRPDFWFKTINAVGYESEQPAEVAAYMEKTSIPWIAFKVLGAGRVKPTEGFNDAFRLGADFVNVGMYDFQVKDDVALVNRAIAAHTTRPRPWSA